MGSFKLGQKKPEGSGRKIGTPNKKSQQLFEVLASLDFNIPEKLIQLLPELPAEKQADILIDLMGYVYPKRKPSEFPVNEAIAAKPKVLVVMPSNGREAPGTKLSRIE